MHRYLFNTSHDHQCPCPSAPNPPNPLPSSKWQPQKIALETIEKLSKAHPDVIASILADVVPPVSDLMASSKPAVQDAAKRVSAPSTLL